MADPCRTFRPDRASLHGDARRYDAHQPCDRKDHPSPLIGGRHNTLLCSGGLWRRVAPPPWKYAQLDGNQQLSKGYHHFAELAIGDHLGPTGNHSSRLTPLLGHLYTAICDGKARMSRRIAEQEIHSTLKQTSQCDQLSLHIPRLKVAYRWRCKSGAA
jgi:hypothetical protein